MEVITREEWLKLSYIRRAWRSLSCKHPFGKSVLIGTVLNPDMDSNDEYFFVAHVRQCCLCREHFLDAGLSTNRKYITPETIASTVLRNPANSKSAKTAAGSALSQPIRTGNK